MRVFILVWQLGSGKQFRSGENRRLVLLQEGFWWLSGLHWPPTGIRYDSSLHSRVGTADGADQRAIWRQACPNSMVHEIRKKMGSTT
jgi:hypothetical protein